MRVRAQLQGRWNDQELEELLRTTHLVACLQGGLSKPDQNIYWISDQDNIFANAQRSQDVSRLLSKFSSYYVGHSLGELGIGTTALDEGDRLEEDLTAVTDLVAGGIAETTNRLSEVCGGRIPHNLAVEYPKKFLSKADLITQWFWAGGSSLRRVAVLFERQAGEGYGVSKLNMSTE
jgi:hypothetical protein